MGPWSEPTVILSPQDPGAVGFELNEDGRLVIGAGGKKLVPGRLPARSQQRPVGILIALLERRGELVSKQDLMARVWPKVFVDPSNLTINMSALRRALRDGRDGLRFIVNIPGRGYRFVASVDVSGDDN
jgi:DNA-binding winged helix-turn-helix (wHTH) protein